MHLSTYKMHSRVNHFGYRSIEHDEGGSWSDREKYLLFGGDSPSIGGCEAETPLDVDKISHLGVGGRAMHRRKSPPPPQPLPLNGRISSYLFLWKIRIAPTHQSWASLYVEDIFTMWKVGRDQFPKSIRLTCTTIISDTLVSGIGQSANDYVGRSWTKTLFVLTFAMGAGSEVFVSGFRFCFTLW